MKPFNSVADAALVKALAHPLRVQIIGTLEHRTASPSELAAELEQPLGNVSYHMRRLEKLGLIALEAETRRRGSIEHHYRLVSRPTISDEGWAQTPSIVKEALTLATLEQIGREVTAAATDGGFEREDIHVSRLFATLDDRGFRELAREARAFVETVRRIEEESAQRLADEDRGAIPAHVVLMLYEGARGTRDA
jgi:DNA-binding transcriptional ArsR family regulator